MARGHFQVLGDPSCDAIVMGTNLNALQEPFSVIVLRVAVCLPGDLVSSRICTDAKAITMIFPHSSHENTFLQGRNIAYFSTNGKMGLPISTERFL
jgi:hypothetical protein